jgi:hypothetical protein
LFNADFSCYNVTPLPEKCSSTSLITTGYKRLAEGGCEAFGWERLFDGGFFAEGRIVGGRLLKGENELLKVKELLKGNC